MASRRINSLYIFAVMLALGATTQTSAVETDSYADEWGPPVGSEILVLEATDHTGVARNLENLTGERGLLLFMVRSADW
jgi:hypothetical protein